MAFLSKFEVVFQDELESSVKLIQIYRIDSEMIKIVFFYRIFGHGSAPMIFDNGRGFGRPFGDYLEILTVFMQCCVIRLSTVKMLLK